MAEEKKWVYMSHPDIKADPVRVTRKAFDDVWSGKGWKLSTKKEVEAAPDASLAKASTTSTKKES